MSSSRLGKCREEKPLGKNLELLFCHYLSLISTDAGIIRWLEKVFYCKIFQKTDFNKKKVLAVSFCKAKKNHILPWENYLGRDAAKMCFAHSKICKPGVDENNRFLCLFKMAKSQVLLLDFILTFMQLYRA